MKIEVKGIAKKYKGKRVLRDINFTAEEGKCIGILGANGSGKSTLLSILAGIQRADKGQFVCDDVELLHNAKRRSQVVGYVPQGTPLIEELTAKDNLRLWYDAEAMNRELEAGVLKLLGIGEFLKVPVTKMSGGMKKRLSIGCAMAAKPPILLLDEPTSALDLACKESIASYLRHYKQEGGILLLTTHDVMELSLCDEWYIIKDGVLEPFAYDGDVSKLVASL